MDILSTATRLKDGLRNIAQRIFSNSKVVGIIVGILIVVVIAGTFTAKAISRYSVEKNRRERIFREKKDYEERLHKVLVQTSKNLVIDQFSGAYNIITSIPPPKTDDTYLREDYILTLKRVAKGLLTIGKLDEAETLFRLVRNYDPNDPEAERGVNFITSERLSADAERTLKEARRYADNRNWKDAVSEFERTLLSLKQVQEARFRNVAEELEAIEIERRECKIQLLNQDAQRFLQTAIEKAKQGDFMKANEALFKAEQRTSLANELIDDHPLTLTTLLHIKETKKTIARLAPAVEPLWNRMAKPDADRDKPTFFLLKNLDVSFKNKTTLAVTLDFECHYRFEGILRISGAYQKSASWQDGLPIPPDSKPPLQLAFTLPKNARPEDFEIIEFKIYDKNDRYLSRYTYQRNKPPSAETKAP